ncbi:S41 family peptidase [Sphingomonas astaxanthinifaciens]|uniref:Peptidase S41 n=1 Tax=Sphingomonas astaxanthinifaciens DSM 22298 TaxID=1123267 RepID=A0ABQ5ZBB3_9SPHN|nr:S41 family peptidase [Sphingomonas astaxanthinifaciens]GLR48776.1 peptidase S41 [Sphingomonas astaxanthinifaciens DSM 22298]
MIRKLLPPLALVGALALVPVTTATVAAADADTYKELETFMGVFERVRANYVDKVDDHQLIKGAIDGMLASLDPHSSYLEASDFQQLKTTTDGNYGGLGLSVTQEDGTVKVIAPTEDTPADRAGIKAGDYITHLDGELLYGLDLDQAVEKMRGPPGSAIKLTIVRPGRDKPFDVTLKRERIELRPVKWEIKDGVGVLNINQFSANVGDQVAAALTAMDKAAGAAKPIGYIIDLRSNPGGLLDQAVSVSDAFLDRGEIVSERGRAKDDIERFYARPGDLTGGKPLIVLVDAGSASAAEIVAGALQDHRRALVMGERSFGKGSVQTVIQLDQNSALRLTTARYYTPSGRSVQAGGIDPDIVVPQLSDPDYKDRPTVREADLRRHLISQNKVDDKLLEKDDSVDPRFNLTAAELEKKGVKDFQLDYAVKALRRLASGPSSLSKAR